jgi:hypothetical protein
MLRGGGFDLDEEMAEMVNGDITARGGLTHDEHDDALPESEIPQPKRQSSLRRMCPAMSQQRTDIGNEAAPQKLIRLVGYRDSRRARTAAVASPTLAPRT